MDPRDLDTRRRVGYMTQSFSLYSELTVRQNLVLHARLFQLPEARIAARVEEMAQRFGLTDVMDALPDALPLGQRQRLSLAVAMIHGPEMLILDEPTSGVDPVARDTFWQIMIDLSRRDEVTIFISTHFMNEAERCDRISLMHAGRVLVSDAPAALMAKREVRHAGGRLHRLPGGGGRPTGRPRPRRRAGHATAAPRRPGHAIARRRRERVLQPAPPVQLRPARGAGAAPRSRSALTLAVLGSVILMLVMGYGISMDVEDLTFAVLDRDQTTISRDYALNLAGSRYFIEQPPLRRLRRSRPAHARRAS